MLAPISWLKEYVDFKMNLKDLMWKMTEIGLTTESFKKEGKEIILDVEVTPNRPDWLSIMGISREIAAITNHQIKEPQILQIPKPVDILKINIKNDFKLCPRYSALIIRDVKQSQSPVWLQQRLKQIGLRPINNLVDITNYVMFEMGNPIHVFDYDKFTKKELKLKLSEGGENFVSVDGKIYELPKNAIVFENDGRIVDLCGIKGGANSGVSNETKNILILVPIYDGILIRKTSQKLGLGSDASKIFERGANAGGTVDTLRRVYTLIKELAGGAVASNIIDVKKEDFKSWKLELSLAKLEKVLGVKLSEKEIIQILDSLTLSPKIKKDKVTCTIPTYRGDLRIEEDLIEEVARIHGYNNFPMTLPTGALAKSKIPYYFDDSFHLKLKNLMVNFHFCEAMTFSLVSKKLVENSQLGDSETIKVANPISSDYEYLRTSIVPNLLAALKLNNQIDLKIFELGKIYFGPITDSKERYYLSGVVKGLTYRQFKGLIEYIFKNLNIDNTSFVENKKENGLWHPAKSAEIFIGEIKIGTIGEIHPQVLSNFEIPEEIFAMEIDVALLQQNSLSTVFHPIPKYPAQIEDITLTFPAKTKIGEVIKVFDKAELVDVFSDSYTFRVWYQDPKKTLTDDEVEKIRNKYLKEIKDKFGGSVKS